MSRSNQVGAVGTVEGCEASLKDLMNRFGYKQYTPPRDSRAFVFWQKIVKELDTEERTCCIDVYGYEYASLGAPNMPPSYEFEGYIEGGLAACKINFFGLKEDDLAAKLKALEVQMVAMFRQIVDAET